MVIQFKIAVTAIFIAGLSCLLWQQAADAVIPNSNNPDGYTEKQYRQSLLAYNKETMSGAYLRVGKRDPRWDDLAVELLDGQAVVFTNSDTYHTDTVPVTTDSGRMLEIVQLLQSMHCDDPLVLYVAMRQMRPSAPGYMPAVRKAYRELRGSRYPAMRKEAAAVWFYQQLEDKGRQDEVGEVLDSIKRSAIEALTGEAVSPLEQRFIYHLTTSFLENLPIAVWKDIARGINESDSPNRWLTDMAQGKYHRDAAWDARGGGWASTVAEAGWKGFQEHQALAETYFVRAWEAEPSLPEAPTQMIELAMGQGTGEERLWFERAVRAQFDYPPAYSDYVWSIRPRWGGSHALMHSFAVECLDTGRFGTHVPSVFYNTMTDIADDAETYDYWKRAGVYEQFLRYFEGRKREPTPSDGEVWWDSMKAAVAWRVGRFEDAAKWMQSLGDDLDTRTFTYFEGDEALVPSEVYARGGEYGDQVRKAQGLWNQQRYRQAADVLDAALKDIPHDDAALPYLLKQSARAAWMHGQATGVWINLLDRTNLGGWEEDRGTWTVDDQGRITGQSSENGLILRCRHTFGYRFEIRGTLTFLGDETTERNNGGVLLGQWKEGDGRYHRDVLLYRNKNLAVAMRHSYYDQDAYPVELGDTNTFHIQMWDDHVRLSVNGQVVYENRKMHRELRDEIHPFALGGACYQAGSHIRYDTLEVKPTYKRPAWVDNQD